MMKARITKGAVKGLLRVAGKDDIRFYLNGIAINADLGEAVATNGHALIVIPIKVTGKGVFILPRSILETCVKGANSLSKLREIILFECDKERVTATFGNQSITDKLLDGKYPDYRSIFPKKFSNKIVQLDTELVNAVTRGLADINATKQTFLVIAHCEYKDTAVAKLDGSNENEGIALIMGFRNTISTADVIAESKAMFTPAKRSKKKPGKTKRSKAA